jgi:plasmid stabilization system protein ParE
MSRSFAVVLSPRASLDLLRARTWLGLTRAGDLDEALEAIRTRLSELPYSGPPAFVGGAFSKTIRRIIVGETGYLLFYRVSEEQGMILVLRIRHEKQRPLKRL